MQKVEIELSEEQLKKLRGNVTCANGPIKIAILQRGWIFVGRFSKVGMDCVLENARCIRQWGTTKGLGELVSGPTSKTILDDASTVRFNEIGIICLIDVDQKGWESKC